MTLPSHPGHLMQIVIVSPSLSDGCQILEFGLPFALQEEEAWPSLSLGFIVLLICITMHLWNVG